MGKRTHFNVTRMNGGQTLHIEAPGCIINIMANLTDAEGRQVTTVEILANGQRFAGDAWFIPNDAHPEQDQRRTSTTIRVRRDK